ncbi:MAG: glycosyltransferase family 2 protein [Candidatus Omnitrophota bacterium]
MIEKPLVSIIILNFNGKDFLERCISSVLESDYDNFEVLFVDNCSTDGSVNFVKENFKDPRIHIIENNRNYGVPGGRNIGLEKTKGEYIVFLDNDTEVDKFWLNGLLEVLINDKNAGLAGSKLLNMGQRNRFEHTGDYLTPFGFISERSGRELDRGQFDKLEEIFSCKGACFMTRRSIFDEVGAFDSDYFMYLEETDFCWRVWLRGYRVVFAYKSLVWHAFMTVLKEHKRYYSNYVIRYYGSRNYITTLIKNLGPDNLLSMLTLHILSWLGISLFFVFKGQFLDGFWILKGITWNIFNLRYVLNKRAEVQNKVRRVKDEQFFKSIIFKRPLSYYLFKTLAYISNREF